MFNLIRRISYGVIPRPDRPWEEDPTSNAPRTQRKRRLSSTDRDADGDDEKLTQKKLRTEPESISVADTAAASTSTSVPPPQEEPLEVKEVTQGVQEVDLEDKQPGGLADEQPVPESVPLPEEDAAGELDEPVADENASSAASSRQNSVEPPSQQDGSDAVATKSVDVEETSSSTAIDATLSEKRQTGKEEAMDSAEVESTPVDSDTTTTKD